MLYSGSLGKVNDKLFMPIETDCNYSMDPYSDNPDDAGYIRFIPISHDAKEPVCSVFGTKTSKAVIATDLGVYDKRLVKCLKNSDYYLIESNHDVRMLEANPRYNYNLKRRILGEGGHLSNEQAGEFMIELTDNGKFLPKHIVLGHLSKDNNIPEAALQSMKNILNAAKIDISGVNIFTALRDEPSEDVYI
jgi:phosphoribosyl 1,2-cyclic phosphodiesterase